MRRESSTFHHGLFFFVAGVLALSLVIGLPAKPAQAQKKPFIFSIGWVFYGRDLGWLTAQEKGFYKEEGLPNVKIVRGFGGGDTMTKVAAGSFTVGGAIPPISQIIAWRKGIKSKMVMMNHDIPPMVIWTTKDRGINSLKDLMGKSIGAPENDAIWPIVKLLYRIKGYDLKRVKHVNVTPAGRDPGMLAGGYAASTGFITQYPILSRMAKQRNKEIHFVLLSNEGLNIYGAGVNVLDKTLKERGEDVRKFLKASVRGIAYALEHPDEAVNYLMKVCPVCKKQPNREVWDITGDMWYTKSGRAKGLGGMTDEKWQKTIDFVAKPLRLKKKPSRSELYTNAYLPGVKLPKRGRRDAPVFQYKE
ncbi:MAG: ABC transporter substrate-binding protein [Nitrospinota bacterium]